MKFLAVFVVSALAGVSSVKAEPCSSFLSHWVATANGQSENGYPILYAGNFPRAANQIRAVAAACSGAAESDISVHANYGINKGGFIPQCRQKVTLCN